MAAPGCQTPAATLLGGARSLGRQEIRFTGLLVMLAMHIWIQMRLLTLKFILRPGDRLSFSL